jgi:hypothetical protein
MEDVMINLNHHIYGCGPNESYDLSDEDLKDTEKLRKLIEPWLTAVFQSEHLSLLLGSGFTCGVPLASSGNTVNMDKCQWGCGLKEKVDDYAEQSAKTCGRGSANIEDQIHAAMQLEAGVTVNTTLTLRNWLIGAYIHHYELHGADRAQYGERLMDKLAEALRPHKIPSTDRQRLYAYRSFYRTYPQIAQTVPQGLHSFDTANTMGIFRSVTGKTVPAAEESEIVRSATVQLELSAEELLGSLSYTHLEQLTALEDPLKRAFYEIECIRGNWSVEN